MRGRLRWATLLVLMLASGGCAGVRVTGYPDGAGGILTAIGIGLVTLVSIGGLIYFYDRHWSP